MKLKLFTILSLIGILAIVSCNKTETFDDRWKNENEAQFAKIVADPEYTKLESQSGEGYIMYKVLESGEGLTPCFTDRVKVLYTGWYKNIWTKPDTYTDENGNVITNKIIFESTANMNDIPIDFDVSPLSQYGVVDGYSTALQHMKEGDKWEIWIPWNLGYGAIGRNNIRGYTTLAFEIELLEVLR